MPPLNSSDFDDGNQTYSDNFAAETAASISLDLGFGEPATLSEETPELANPAAATKPETKSVSEPNAAEPRIVEGQNSVNLKPLPKSWKKEMAPLWDKADPALHDYVYNREADVMRGIQQYQKGYQQWDTLIKPFAPIFEQHPQENPVQIMQGLMNTHLQFLNPSLPAAKKAEMLQGIAREYGINLSGEAAAEPNAELLQLRQQVANLQRTFAAREEATYNSGVEQQLQAVNAFAADPKNLYFEEVANDIHRFLQTGAATDLASAYELACYANPAVRAKMLAAQQQVQSPPPNQRDDKGRFRNIEGDPPKPVRHRKGTIDETIDGIVNDAYARAK